MFDVKALVEEFKLGGIECIFICFISYFIIGYLILFTIYENGFINLNLSTQIFLAISISFPIATTSVLLTSDEEDEELTEEDVELTEEYMELTEEYMELTEEDVELTEEDEESTEKDKSGFFYRLNIDFIILSLYYSIMFPLFYIVKKSDLIHYDSKIDPFIGLAIILLFFVIAKYSKG